MSDPETIPGLELPQLTAAPSALAQAVDATLSQLVNDEHLDPSRDAARIALARELAAVIAHKRTSGRASTVGNDARVLLDLLDGMVPTEAATSADAALANAMREWTAHIESQGAASGD
jgi:hypothetical protein